MKVISGVLSPTKFNSTIAAITVKVLSHSLTTFPLSHYFPTYYLSLWVEIIQIGEWIVCAKLQLEGIAGFSVSPGKNPSVAVFVPERKGSPAIVRLYGMLSFNFPLSNKSFYKADEVEFNWNPIGIISKNYVCTFRYSNIRRA